VPFAVISSSHQCGMQARDYQAGEVCMLMLDMSPRILRRCGSSAGDQHHLAYKAVEVLGASLLKGPAGLSLPAPD
jgi:hypothetical protein